MHHTHQIKRRTSGACGQASTGVDASVRAGGRPSENHQDTKDTKGIRFLRVLCGLCVFVVSFSDRLLEVAGPP